MSARFESRLTVGKATSFRSISTLDNWLALTGSMMAVRAKESSIGSARSGVKPSHNAVTSLSNYGKLIACRAWKGNKMKTTLATLLLAISLTAPAADLSIALGGDVTSMDPHFHNLTPNNNVCQHVFDTLVMKDAGGGIKPGLAESWRVVDDLTRYFK